MADFINGRCYAQKAPDTSPPLIQHGDIVFQAHHVGWLITGCFTLISMITSFWLMNKHLQWYTNKKEQRYIVRILLMVPLYAVISFASYLFWNHSTPLLLLRDCYESTVLTAFFYLLLLYLSPDPVEQKEIFRKEGLSRENDRRLLRIGEKPKKWMLPLSMVKWKPEDGLYFLQLMKWGVLQYCVIRPVTTLAAVILDYVGLYCEDSWSPGWGHIYITAIVSVSVSVAMYCLIQLYVPISGHLKPQKPLLKLVAIKAVVFLTFWQATGLSLLTMFGVVKDTPYMTADNINIGLGALLETFEMMLFAFLHIKAFTYKPYRTPPYRTRRLRALGHAFDFRETLRELWAGMIYMVDRTKGRETDAEARRQAVLEGVFGRSRIQIRGSAKLQNEGPQLGAVEKGELFVGGAVEETAHIGEERQWLGVGETYGDGLGYHSRRTKEKSEDLGQQIEKELAKRGYSRRQPSGRGSQAAMYDLLDPTDLDGDAVNHQRRDHSSWWKKAYHRFSHSETPGGPTIDGQDLQPQLQSIPSEFKRTGGRRLSHAEVLQHTYEDPPPPSAIRSYKESKSKRTTLQTPPSTSVSMPAPLPSSSFPLLLERPSRQKSTSNAPPMDEFRYLAGNTSSPQRSSLGTPALASPAPTSPSDCSDSFWGRIFVGPTTDASHSGEALTAGATSSQSHRSRVGLASEPAVVANATVVTHAPVLVPPYHAPDDERILAIPPRLLRSQNVPRSAGPAHILANNEDSHHQGGFDVHLSARHARQSAVREPPRVAPDATRKPRMLKRDQIVLPAPLAPAAGRSATRDDDSKGDGASPRTPPPWSQSPSSGSFSPRPFESNPDAPVASSSRARMRSHRPQYSTTTTTTPTFDGPVLLRSLEGPAEVPQLRRQRATRGASRRHSHAFAEQPPGRAGRRLSAPPAVTAIPEIEFPPQRPVHRS